MPATRRLLLGSGLALGGVLLGVGGAVGVGAVTGDDEASAGPVASSSRPLSSGSDEPRAVNQDLGPVARAASPAEAVEQFVAAEQAGDTARSFALLTDADRRSFGAPGAWRAAHPDVLPPVLRSETTATPADAAGTDAATVETTTAFRSSLDAVAGLVPARAEVVWSVRREGGGWAVDLQGTTQQPLLPPAEDATAAAAAWARATQGCEPAPPHQYEPSLRGRALLADELCGSDGEVSAGAPAPLAPEDLGTFTAVYGGDAAGWARAVPLSGPTDLRVVLAPVEDRWQVVGVLEHA